MEGRSPACSASYRGRVTDSLDSGRERGPRLGDSRAPVTNVMVLAAAAIAVIAGFAILRSVTNETPGSDDAATTVVTATATTTAATAAAVSTTAPPATTTTSTTTTVAPTADKTDAIIVVANASGVDRSATAMTDELSADGYTTAPVANSTGPRLQRSIIYYVRGNEGALGVARLLATQIPTARTLPMPDQPPLDRPLDEATVVLLLGRDAAGRPLAELATD
jgi:cytoskeletal protein RodZ